MSPVAPELTEAIFTTEPPGKPKVGAMWLKITQIKKKKKLKSSQDAHMQK